MCDKIISQNQTAFIKGRFILESVVTAHEIVQVVHTSGSKGMFFTINYGKAYKKVSLDFLYEVLRRMGFVNRWIQWIKSSTHEGSVGVKVNGEESNFFITKRGLRQGYPFSPPLFNLAVNVFARTLIMGSNSTLIKGLCPNLNPGGAIYLECAYDTLLFMGNDVRVALNLKWILTCFEFISG